MTVAAPLTVLAVPEYVAITRADVSAAPVAPSPERVVAIRVGVDVSKFVGAPKVNDPAVTAGGVAMLACENTDAELAGNGACVAATAVTDDWVGGVAAGTEVDALDVGELIGTADCAADDDAALVDEELVEDFEELVLEEVELEEDRVDEVVSLRLPFVVFPAPGGDLLHSE